MIGGFAWSFNFYYSHANRSMFQNRKLLKSGQLINLRAPKMLILKLFNIRVSKSCKQRVVHSSAIGQLHARNFLFEKTLPWVSRVRFPSYATWKEISCSNPIWSPHILRNFNPIWSIWDRTRRHVNITQAMFHVSKEYAFLSSQRNSHVPSLVKSLSFAWKGWPGGSTPSVPVNVAKIDGN